jgi:uncharacterized protein YjbI with pentapeptide repeats
LHAVDVQVPDLPQLEALTLEQSADAGDLELTGVSVERSALEPLTVGRIRIEESTLEGVALAGTACGVAVRDALLRDCDLSNADGRGGSLARVAAERCRLVGINLADAAIRDLRAEDSSLLLASFARATLERVVFEDANLSEASFMDARLEQVSFVGCELRGADFRGARLSGCSIRGAALDGVLGVDSLAGVTMPWEDVIASAGALAQALGIVIERE